jgi:metal-responsive CopG/Arc/MetJ family transcriptional regulator
MVKKVIQLVIDEDLLKSLDVISKRKTKARSEIIRQACHRYLQQAETEELDKIYQQGYLRIPEESGLGEAQEAILSETLNEEQW